jgi:hypothetical protein
MAELDGALDGLGLLLGQRLDLRVVHGKGGDAIGVSGGLDHAGLVVRD